MAATLDRIKLVVVGDPGSLIFFYNFTQNLLSLALYSYKLILSRQVATRCLEFEAKSNSS